MNEGQRSMTREEWLLAAAAKLAPLYQQGGHEMPAVRLGVGLPLGRATPGNNQTIGQCWKATITKDGIAQVYVSPVLECPVKVLGTLAHEIIHAILPDAKHGPTFKRLALAIGLTGKMTHTIPGPELTKELEKIAAELGPYPHGALQLEGRKKQTTRLLKAECPECGYTVRLTMKWLAYGPPICPLDQISMEVKG